MTFSTNILCIAEPEQGRGEPLLNTSSLRKQKNMFRSAIAFDFNRYLWVPTLLATARKVERILEITFSANLTHMIHWYFLNFKF